MTFKRSLMYCLMLAVFVLLTELFSSALLFYYYKNVIYDNLYDQSLSTSSTLTILRLACQRLRVCSPTAQDRITSEPSPLYSADTDLGYTPTPGRHLIKYRKRNRLGREDVLQTVLTINPNGTRFVGRHVEQPQRTIYVFGDSYVFGEGVNDEQTFTYLLQNSFPESRFVLYAAGGYSLTQAYIRFEQIKQQIQDSDLLILSYAEWYKVRNVAAPSRLREYGIPGPMIRDPEIKHPRAGIDADGRIVVDLVPLFCKFNGNYCEQPDPSTEYMDRVAAGLITAMTEGTKARIVLLHFAGRKDDPVLEAVTNRVEVLSATEGDFDYMIRDDIMHFDMHPGPYWHYAIYTKVARFLRSNGYSIETTGPNELQSLHHYAQ